MTFVVAGIFGLGGPEVLALLVLILVLVVGRRLMKPLAGREAFTRYCPKCARGLTQQADAPLCSYCGNRLP